MGAFYAGFDIKTCARLGAKEKDTFFRTALGRHRMLLCQLFSQEHTVDVEYAVLSRFYPVSLPPLISETVDGKPRV